MMKKSLPLLIAAFDRALVAFSLSANSYAVMHQDLMRGVTDSGTAKALALSPEWRQPLIERFGDAPATAYVRDYRGRVEPPGLTVGLWRDRLHNLVFPTDWKPATTVSTRAKRAVFLATLVSAFLCWAGQMKALVHFATPSVGHVPQVDPPEYALEVAHLIECYAAYIPFKIECLAFASALTHVLRKQGVPAELVIGIARFPFAAHAWCQLGDLPLAETPHVKDELAVIFRSSDVGIA